MSAARTATQWRALSVRLGVMAEAARERGAWRMADRWQFHSTYAHWMTYPPVGTVVGAVVVTLPAYRAGDDVEIGVM